MDLREKLIELLDEFEVYRSEVVAQAIIDSGVTEQSEIDAKTFQLMRECERIKEEKESLANAVNVLEEINSDLCKKLNGVTVQEWIPVTERLPVECPHPYNDMKKAVLIYTPVDGYTHIGWYAGKDWRGRDEWKTLSAMRSYQTCTKKVSHWAYLPEPPKGD